jgi:hypothetical protein
VTVVAQDRDPLAARHMLGQKEGCKNGREQIDVPKGIGTSVELDEGLARIARSAVSKRLIKGKQGWVFHGTEYNIHCNREKAEIIPSGKRPSVPNLRQKKPGQGPVPAVLCAPMFSFR